MNFTLSYFLIFVFLVSAISNNVYSGNILEELRDRVIAPPGSPQRILGDLATAPDKGAALKNNIRANPVLRQAETHADNLGRAVQAASKIDRPQEALAEVVALGAKVATEGTCPNPAMPRTVLPSSLADVPFLNMDVPKPKLVNPLKVTTPPVIYVNGLYTSEQQARSEAAALSRNLGRPVYLLFNDNQDVAAFPKAAVDRWGNAGLPELNSVSRQLAHIFYHADGPVSVVSHSHGCIIVRNALRAADAIGRSSNKVAWVATGSPILHSEINPEPMNFHMITNPSDAAIGQAISTNFGSETFKNDNLLKPEAHYFEESYVPQIRGDYLFPNSAPNLVCSSDDSEQLDVGR